MNKESMNGDRNDFRITKMGCYYLFFLNDKERAIMVRSEDLTNLDEIDVDGVLRKVKTMVPLHLNGPIVVVYEHEDGVAGLLSDTLTHPYVPDVLYCKSSKYVKSDILIENVDGLPQLNFFIKQSSKDMLLNKDILLHDSVVINSSELSLITPMTNIFGVIYRLAGIRQSSKDIDKLEIVYSARVPELINDESYHNIDGIEFVILDSCFEVEVYETEDAFNYPLEPDDIKRYFEVIKHNDIYIVTKRKGMDEGQYALGFTNKPLDDGDAVNLNGINTIVKEALIVASGTYCFITETFK